MRNLQLVLEYDGTQFLGFQKQRQGRTVQQVLEEGLARILGERVRVVAAGRTDSGVHARGQVVNFKTGSRLPGRSLLMALNATLPEDLAVKKVRTAAPAFHARFRARRKIYSYRVLLGRPRAPLDRRYVYHYHFPVNVALVRKGAKILEGCHDFRSFQARAGEGREGKSAVRTLYRLRVHEEKPYLTFRFEGDGFLYNMVRNMVGTLLWLGRGKIPLEDLPAILKARDRRLAGPTVPPQGLVLEKVVYPR